MKTRKETPSSTGIVAASRLSRNRYMARPEETFNAETQRGRGSQRIPIDLSPFSAPLRLCVEPPPLLRDRHVGEDRVGGAVEDEAAHVRLEAPDGELVDQRQHRGVG